MKQTTKQEAKQMCETDDEPRGLADISIDCPHCDRLVGHAYNEVAFQYQCGLEHCPHCKHEMITVAVLDMLRANYYWVSYEVDPLACERLRQRMRLHPDYAWNIPKQDILDCIAVPHAHSE